MCIRDSIQYVSHTCNLLFEWRMGCGAVDGLFAAIVGRQVRRSRCIGRMWLFAKYLTWVGCVKAMYLCAHPKVGCVNILCMVGNVRHCYGTQREGSAHVTHIRITLSSSTFQAHGAVGTSFVGLGHDYSCQRHLIWPVRALRRTATRVAHPS